MFAYDVGSLILCATYVCVGIENIDMVGTGGVGTLLSVNIVAGEGPAAAFIVALFKIL